MERDSVYHLSVELARGSLNRLRNQIALWQSVGMTIAAAVSKQVEQSLEHLALAATLQRVDPEAAHDEAQHGPSSSRSPPPPNWGTIMPARRSRRGRDKRPKPPPCWESTLGLRRPPKVCLARSSAASTRRSCRWPGLRSNAKRASATGR